MKLEYVPLLQLQRDIQGLPRNYKRFRQYLRTITSQGGAGLKLPSLLMMNPMGKDHVTALLDALLTLDADGIATRAVAEARDQLTKEPGDFKVALVIADDLMGGWTNRYANEFSLRFPQARAGAGMPRWLTDLWITSVVWSSEVPSEQAVREAILTAIYRVAFLQLHGRPRTLGEKLAQEGAVMARAGCTRPVLDEEEIAYTREVLVPFLDAEDMRTTIECLFGDAPAHTLGFSPHGLSPWAGLALALHDAKNGDQTRSSRSPGKR
ncbi:MAG: hypothetical protein ACJ8FY_03045 [Gemmataceae bacterium]